MCWHLMHCFTLCVIWKLWFELGLNLAKAIKKWRCSWSQYHNQMFQEILLELPEPPRSGRVGLKQWIVRLYSQPNLFSSVWKVSGEFDITQSRIVTFTTIKESRAVEFCLTYFQNIAKLLICPYDNFCSKVNKKLTFLFRVCCFETFLNP